MVRDLHDGAQQRLVHTVITLKLARRALAERARDAPALLTEALDHAEQATAELRELAHGILPAVLTQGGLRAGVDALASRMPVPVENDVSVGRLPAAIEATAYFVVAEALTNVAKHARAAAPRSPRAHRQPRRDRACGSSAPAATSGIEAVAVYSEADARRPARAPRRRGRRDRPGPGRPRATCAPTPIVEAAESAGADAMHPGYGFLAEEPALRRRACAEAGIAFVGPPADAMAAVGDKVTARAAAERAGVPVVPGTGRVEDARRPQAAAEEIGYPVLIKASAGGGGRGIRTRRRRPTSCARRSRSASAEAEAAFGDGGVYSRSASSSRGTSRCRSSADDARQRRPPLRARLLDPAAQAEAHRGGARPEHLDAPLRERLCDAAVAVAREAGYIERRHGRVPRRRRQGAFYFIEVNARIQVEHPVTEMRHRHRPRRRAAARRGRPAAVVPPGGRRRRGGCAIEFRINAEDPTQRLPAVPGRRSSTCCCPAGPACASTPA